MANVTTVQTIAALQATATPAGAVTQLSKAGREGNFIWKTGNFTTQATSDPLMGIYVPSTVTAITSGCWVREWDGIIGRPEWFGAVVGDSSAGARTATLAALNAAVAVLPSTALSSGTYYVDGVWRIDQDGRRVVGLGRDKTVISSNHATAHIIHCGGVPGSHYAERPYLEGMTLIRTVFGTVPSNSDDDKDTAHGLHMKMTSNATVREIDTAGVLDSNENPTGSNLVGIYWANALSPLWEDCFDLMTGTGARSYSFMLDGTEDDGLGPKFPSLVVFRGRELRMTNKGSSALSRGLLILGSYTDMQVDRVETAGVHNGLLCIGGATNAHFKSHWHDGYKADGIKVDKTGASSGENITFVDCYCAPGVGATGQPFTLVNAQNVQIIAAQISSYPGGGDGKIGALFSSCVNCTISGQVVNHSTGVKFDNCYGCDADVKVVKMTGTGIDGIKVQGGFGNKARCGIVGVSGSVGFGTGVALASTGGNFVDLSGMLDSTVTNRLTIDGSVVGNAGNVTSANFVIRPGAAFNTSAT